MSKLTDALYIAENFDVVTPKDKVVLYSISYLPTRENKDKALAFLKEHEDFFTLDDTPCGKQLISLGLETGSGTPEAEILKIWAIASKRFIQSASGNVTAFVDNADERSTFVSVELPQILKNDKINTVNNEDKFKFAERFIKDVRI